MRHSCPKSKISRFSPTFTSLFNCSFPAFTQPSSSVKTEPTEKEWNSKVAVLLYRPCCFWYYTVHLSPTLIPVFFSLFQWAGSSICSKRILFAQSALCQYIMSYISLNSNILSNFQVLKIPFFLTYSDDFQIPWNYFFNILNFSSHRTSYNSDPEVFHLVRPSFLT